MKITNDYSKIADLYDAYVQDTFDIPFFLKEARLSSGEVLELMSGTGRVSIPLIEASIQLTCVDNSPEMLSLLENKLEQRNLNAAIYQVDVRQLSLDRRYNLIFIPFNSFSELINHTDQTETLTAIYNHLTDSGRFICTLHNPEVRMQTVDGNLHLFRTIPLEKPKGKILLWGVESYDDQSRVVHMSQFIEVYDKKDIMIIRKHIDIYYFVHQKEEFQALLESTGFQIDALYGDYSYSKFESQSSPFMIWITKKVKEKKL